MKDWKSPCDGSLQRRGGRRQQQPQHTQRAEHAQQTQKAGSHDLLPHRPVPAWSRWRASTLLTPHKPGLFLVALLVTAACPTLASIGACFALLLLLGCALLGLAIDAKAPNADDSALLSLFLFGVCVCACVFFGFWNVCNQIKHGCTMMVTRASHALLLHSQVRVCERVSVCVRMRVSVSVRERDRQTGRDRVNSQTSAHALLPLFFAFVCFSWHIGVLWACGFVPSRMVPSTATGLPGPRIHPSQRQHHILHALHTGLVPGQTGTDVVQDMLSGLRPKQGRSRPSRARIRHTQQHWAPLPRTHTHTHTHTHTGPHTHSFRPSLCRVVLCVESRWVRGVQRRGN